MLSSPYWVKAKLLGTIQKVLPSLTPQSSSLIWLPALHTTLNSSYCMHLICASIFFVPRELLLTLRDPIQTLPPFQSISWLLQAKQVVTLHLPLYYIFLLHLLGFFCFVCLFYWDHLLECLSFFCPKYCELLMSTDCISSIVSSQAPTIILDMYLKHGKPSPYFWTFHHNISWWVFPDP